MATVQGDDITDGGERSVVENLLQKDFKKEKRDQDGSDRRRRGPREEWKNLESGHQMGSRRHHDRGGAETCQADVEGS